MICVRRCTENLAIAVVASRLLELPVFCTEDADVSADTRKLLAILHWNCEKCDANQKRCLLTFTIKVWNVCTAFTVKANGLCFWLFLTFSKLHYSLERNWEVFVQVGSFQWVRWCCTLLNTTHSVDAISETLSICHKKVSGVSLTPTLWYYSNSRFQMSSV